RLIGNLLLIQIQSRLAFNSPIDYFEIFLKELHRDMNVGMPAEIKVLLDYEGSTRNQVRKELADYVRIQFSRFSHINKKNFDGRGNPTGLQEIARNRAN